jgi:intein/homing endonuclease
VEYELDRDARGEFKAGYPDRDNHCLTGDTIVNTLDGGFPISQLVGKQGRVYCYDNGPAVSQFSNVRMTQKDAPVFEIELQDGREIKATAEHPILTQSGWKRAQDLTDNDLIMDIGGSLNA